MLECWKKRFFQYSILPIFPEQGVKGIHSLKGHDEEIVLGRSWTVVIEDEKRRLTIDTDTERHQTGINPLQRTKRNLKLD